MRTLDDVELEAMLRAIDEARKCSSEAGRESPMVGAALIQAGGVAATAYRSELSEGDHAEFTLLEKKLPKADVAGATLVTTLEPCTSRTDPKIPCADRIIGRGIRRVIVGMLDPNPDITGKGILRLRDAQCAIEFFPPELMARVEGLNLAFSSRHRLTKPQSAELIDGLSHRELDAWYIAINRIYWHRNAHVPLSFVLAHLVEVVGGLSYLASEKSKPHVDAAAYVQKAVAWWLAICGKAGINSVTDLIWRKFPGVCPYCSESPHNDDKCREFKRTHAGPDWEALNDLGRHSVAPKRPSDWLKMFRHVYPVSQNDVYGPTFARLSEELGELSEAVRLFDEEPQYFLSEAADVFAWLMRIENIRETKANSGYAQIGRALDVGLAESYPDFCRDCEARPCRCPPILKRTVGRIAKEVPRRVSGDSFMSATDRRALFGA